MGFCRPNGSQITKNRLLGWICAFENPLQQHNRAAISKSQRPLPAHGQPRHFPLNFHKRMASELNEQLYSHRIHAPCDRLVQKEWIHFYVQVDSFLHAFFKGKIDTLRRSELIFVCSQFEMQSRTGPAVGVGNRIQQQVNSLIINIVFGDIVITFMINRLVSQTAKTLVSLPKYSYIQPPKHS